MIYKNWTVTKDLNKLEYEITCSCGNIRNVRKNLFKSSIKGVGRKINDSCKDCCKQLQKNSKTDLDLFNHYLKIIKLKAASRKNGIHFEIEEPILYKLIKSNCIYCNEIPKNNFTIKHKSGNLFFTYQGLDRIDSSKTYTLDNVVPCCKRCNKAKGEDSLESFLTWLNRFNNFESSTVIEKLNKYLELSRVESSDSKREGSYIL